MRDEDPDALWRPGYTGSYGYPVPPPARRRRTPRVVGALVVAVAIVAALAVAGAFVAVRDPPGSLGDAVRLPRDGRPRWSATIDDVAVARVAGSSRALVLADTGAHRIVVLDARTGRERWRHDGDIGAVTVIGDHLVATETGAAGRTAVVVRSLEDGVVAWRRVLGPHERLVTDQGQLLVASTPTTGRQRLELVDVAGGEVTASVEGGRVTWTRAQVQVRDGDRVAVHARRRLERLGAVDLGSLDLGDQDAAVAVSSAGPLVAGGGTLVLVDADGGRQAALTLGPVVAGATEVGIDVLDDAGRIVAVQQGDHLLVVAAEGGALRELWAGSAWLVDWHLDADRELLAIAGRTGSIVATAPEVVDARTGAPVWDGPAAVQQSSPRRVFGDDGFIAVQREGAFGAAQVIVGYDLDRTEQWRRAIDRWAWPTLIAAGLVVVAPGPGAASTITLYA